MASSHNKVQIIKARDIKKEPLGHEKDLFKQVLLRRGIIQGLLQLSVAEFGKVEIRSFVDSVAGRWISGKDGTPSRGRFTMSGRTSKRASTRKSLKITMKPQEGEDIPFGPPLDEYNYRCSRCGCDVWVNEAIIDFELGFAAFEGREPKMPILGCPGCNRETMKYTGIKRPPEGR